MSLLTCITGKLIWAAAGSPHALLKLSPEDLAALTNGIWIDCAQEWEAGLFDHRYQVVL